MQPSGAYQNWQRAESGDPPGDLAFVDIQASLGHVAHPSLGLFAGERVEVVHEGGLVRHLKVADATVPLDG